MRESKNGFGKERLVYFKGVESGIGKVVHPNDSQRCVSGGDNGCCI